MSKCPLFGEVPKCILHNHETLCQTAKAALFTLRRTGLAQTNEGSFNLEYIENGVILGYLGKREDE